MCSLSTYVAALLMILSATYMTAYTLEIASSTFSLKVFGDRLQFSSLSIMPVVWLTYAFRCRQRYSIMKML